MRHLAPGVLLVVIAAGASSTVAGPGCGAADPRYFATELAVVDGDGQPISGARIEHGDQMLLTDRNGRARLDELVGPILVLVAGDGFMPEPVTVGRADASRTVRVRLFEAEGGTRWVMHVGGDAMLARYYEEPAKGEPLIRAGHRASDARAVVEPLQRAFAAADLRMLNLDSAATDLPSTAAYPGKQMAFATRLDSLAALESMGVDVAVLANDHVRDYLDIGVAETLASLAARGIRHVGAHLSRSAAEAPAVLTVGDMQVGVLAWNIPTGSSLNDLYPRDGEPHPADSPAATPEDAARVASLYEAREWGFEGDTLFAPIAARRIGTAWELFDGAESDMDEPEAAAAWQSLSAVYPELQDWVARRGHGGAARWNTSRARAEIESLAARTDLVIVHLHGGFFAQSAPSELVRRAARVTIDAGADVVIGHHARVLQGVEWYKGKLIVYSIGQLLSDSEDFDTAPGGFLRLVWQGSSLLEARFVLYELDGMRPSPVADRGAERAALTIWERSRTAAQAESARDVPGCGTGTGEELEDDSTISCAIAIELDGDTEPASIRMRNHSAVIAAAEAASDAWVLSVEPGAIVPLGYQGLVAADESSGTDLWLGRDLIGWGGFEDMLADGEYRAKTHWLLDSSSERVLSRSDAPGGVSFLRLGRSSLNLEAVAVQAMARVRVPVHRLYEDTGERIGAVDGMPGYSVRLTARRLGTGTAAVRLERYRVHRSSPIRDFYAEPLGHLDIPIDIPADGQWRMLDLPVPDGGLSSGGVPADEVLLSLRADPPERTGTYIDIDDVALLEWRRAADLAGRFGAHDMVRNTGSTPVTVVLAGLSLQQP